MDTKTWKERLARYDKLIGLANGIERKGKTMPYTSDNGYMFSLLNKAGEIGIRFSKDTKEVYLKKHSTTLYKSYGATMKGYILITEEMLKDLSSVADLINESHAYVKSLPPK